MPKALILRVRLSLATPFYARFGTTHCDFPDGDARQLHQSIRKVLYLPCDTILHTGHDYHPGGCPTQFATTVAAQRALNLHVGGEATEDNFVAIRTARDAGLALPALMLPSVQKNIRVGRLPETEPNGIAYLKIALNSWCAAPP